MKIQFVAGVTPITSNPAGSAGLYFDALGLPLGGEQRYLSTDSLEGVKHFGVWSIQAAAQSCFGRDTWPGHIPVPQATIEFELEDVAAVGAATEELAGKGFEIIHGAKEEPWGQTIARFLSPEGLLIGLSYAPWMHEDQA